MAPPLESQEGEAMRRLFKKGEATLQKGRDGRGSCSTI